MVREKGGAEGGFIYQAPKRLAPWLKRIRLLSLKGGGRQGSTCRDTGEILEKSGTETYINVCAFLIIQGA